MTTHNAITIYLLALNTLAFLAMGHDKLKAKRHLWRTPEVTLILLAALGGSVGAILGMSLFHHKTNHAKFKVGLPLILVLQLGLGAFLLYHF